VEGAENKGGKSKGGGGEIRTLRVGKRIESITTARNTTRDLGFELVQISIDQSKPLLTVQIKPKNQGDTFPSLIDSGATANFISPKLIETLKIPRIALSNPRKIRMLDRSTPKTGKVWHKVHLEFECQGLPTSAEFLVCPTGNNQAILGMPWLKDQNPSIDWKEQIITLSESVQIAL
jgi:predicted aspartyl protease